MNTARLRELCYAVENGSARMEDLAELVALAREAIDPWANVSPFCLAGKHALTWGGTPENPRYYSCDCTPSK